MIINFNTIGGGTPSPTPGGKQYFKPVDKLPASADEKGTTVYVKEGYWDTTGGFFELSVPMDEPIEAIAVESQPNMPITLDVMVPVEIPMEIGMHPEGITTILESSVPEGETYARFEANGGYLQFVSSNGMVHISTDNGDEKDFEWGFVYNDFSGIAGGMGVYAWTEDGHISIDLVSDFELTAKSDSANVMGRGTELQTVTYQFDGNGNIIAPEGYFYSEDEQAYINEDMAVYVMVKGGLLAEEITEAVDGWENKWIIYAEYGVICNEQLPYPIYAWDSSEGGYIAEGYHKWNGEGWEIAGLEIRTMSQGEYDMLPESQKMNPNYLFNITD